MRKNTIVRTVTFVKGESNKLYIRNDKLIVDIYIDDNLYKTCDFNLSEVLKVFETLLEEVNT